MIGIKERIFSNNKALELWNTFRKELPISLQSLDKYQKAFEILGKKVEKPVEVKKGFLDL
ncbi:hypothetical protein AD998_21835 [bacterium 336/3]|nr:hypothetical protein AD998_21835 [bacterium 336/3]